MAEVHQHPDGLVYVRTDDGVYMDTLENFALDYGQGLPALPAGADDRIYAQGKRHAIMGGGNVIAGGPVPWDLGDQLINSVSALLAAQDARRNPPLTLDQAIASKDAVIEHLFEARHTAPILYAVGGTDYEWHADDEAVTNIMGVVLMIVAGVPVPNPRSWTPKGSLTPVEITHAELVHLGAVIAARKDALFVRKKAKQAEVAAMTDVADVLAYDPALGWE